MEEDVFDMRPKPEDTSVLLPVTFDYKGGKSTDIKSKIILAVIAVVSSVTFSIVIMSNEDIIIWLRLIYTLIGLYVGLYILRFFVFGEQKYSNMLEELKETDYDLPKDSFWQIFDIDSEPPYICYFRNGYKGIFIKMVRGVITGKGDNYTYRHYENLGDAYNMAHSLNMNLVHLDYMDNVGNDARMQTLYNDLIFVSNPEMQDLLLDMYSNLQDNMDDNYTTFDVYLFLTRDKITNFIYNVRSVCTAMLGGNFITFKLLDRYELANACVALFNLKEFSIVEACEGVLNAQRHSGIIPISLTHADGSVEEFNKTRAEKEAINKERQRLAKERQLEQESKKKRKKKGVVDSNITPTDNTDIDLFSNQDDDINMF